MFNSSRTESGAQIDIKKPFGRLLILALTLIIGLVLLIEAISRIDFVQSYFRPLHSVGSSHEEFELKLILLEQFIEKHKALDCLIIGSSEAKRAVNPEIFDVAFQNVTGKEIHCFNFALQGAGLPTLVPLSEYLVETYHPELVIFGNSVHGYGDNFGDSAFQEIGQNPWLLYKTGNFNLEGWLIEHSYAYRSFLTYRNWMATDFGSQIQARKKLLASLSTGGYQYQPISFDIMKNIHIPPDPTILSKAEELNEISDPGKRQRLAIEINMFILLDNYEISPRKLEMLSKILELESRTQFIVIEVPVHPTFFSFYADPQDYVRAANLLGEYFRERDVEFWRAKEPDMVPDQGWRNRNHMNYIGAEIFSTWLGEEVGRAVLDGWISDPTE